MGRGGRSRKNLKKTSIRMRTLPTPPNAKRVGVKMTKRKTYVTWILKKRKK